MKIAIYSIIMVIAGIALLVWSGHRDQQVNTAMQAYEKCVQDEYGTTPSHWYAEHGELPPCQR